MDKKVKQPSQEQKAEARAFKKAQKAALYNREEVKPDKVEVKKPPVCLDCNGTGLFGQLVVKQACKTCLGSGYSIDDPNQVIEYQAKRLKRAASIYRMQKQQIKELLAQNELVKQSGLSRQALEVRGYDVKGKLD